MKQIKCEFIKIVISYEVPKSEKPLWNWISRYVRNDNCKHSYFLNRLLGEQVLKINLNFHLNFNSTSNKLHWDDCDPLCSKVQTGVYFLVVSTDEKIIAKKIALY